MIPFEKKNITKNAERFINSEYANILIPTLVAYREPIERIKRLSIVMLENRKFVKNAAQEIYEEEVKKRFHDILNNNKLQEKRENFFPGEDNVKSIFGYYVERYDMDWRSMMKETSQIFLSPVILNKHWMIQVKAKVESRLNYRIVRDLNYDSAKCCEFAHTITQKHVKDLTTKLFKPYLDKFGVKLLTKTPKNGNTLHNVEKFSINHSKFDMYLKETHVFCVSSSNAHFLECTSSLSNEIKIITATVGKEIADEYSGYDIENDELLLESGVFGKFNSISMV